MMINYTKCDKKNGFPMRRDLSLLIQLEDFNARNRLGLLQSFSYNQQTYPALVSNVKLNGFHLPLPFLFRIAAAHPPPVIANQNWPGLKVLTEINSRTSCWKIYTLILGEIYKLIDLRDRVIPHSDAAAQSMVRAIDFNTYGPVFIINISVERTSYVGSKSCRYIDI